jgi:hypothetical protein
VKIESRNGAQCSDGIFTAKETQSEHEAGTFDLLGFTHDWGETQKSGWAVKRKTMQLRLARSIKESISWCISRGKFVASFATSGTRRKPVKRSKKYSAKSIPHGLGKRYWWNYYVERSTRVQLATASD